MIHCEECNAYFEPPFDPIAFLYFLDECQKVEGWLCYACADLEFIEEGVPKSITLVHKDTENDSLVPPPTLRKV